MSGKILIIDDVATNRVVLRVKLTSAGYQPLLAASADEGLRIAKLELPDLILMDAFLPDLDISETLTALRDDPITNNIPVLVHSSVHNEETRIKAFRAGADDFLAKPVDSQTLLARIRGLLRDRDGFDGLAVAPGAAGMFGMAEKPSEFVHAGHIGIVVATAESGLYLRRSLTPYTQNKLTIITAEDLLAKSMTDVSPPDVYLIEEDLGSAGSGLRMMSELMSRPFSRNCTFAILTNDDRVQGNSVVFDLGADDLIASTISGEEIALRLSRLLQRKRRKDVQRSSVQDGLRMAMIDPLTGLHNRRFGLARLAVIAQEAKVTGLAFAILVVDIDRFKLVNDTLGHSAGDTVLVEVAERLAMNIRQGDLVARIGGEEFLIVLPVTTLAEAQIIADRVRDQVEANAIYLANRKRVCVTVSIGLAMSGALNLSGHQNTIAEIIDRADHALMAAKSGGRNKVTIARNAA